MGNEVCSELKYSVTVRVYSFLKQRCAVSNSYTILDGSIKQNEKNNTIPVTFRNFKFEAVICMGRRVKCYATDRIATEPEFVNLLKGQCHEIFYFKFFFVNHFPSNLKSKISRHCPFRSPGIDS